MTLAALNSVTGVPDDTATVVFDADAPVAAGDEIWPVIGHGFVEDAGAQTGHPDALVPVRQFKFTF